MGAESEWDVSGKLYSINLWKSTCRLQQFTIKGKTILDVYNVC